MSEGERSHQCHNCDCGLYVIMVNASNEIVALECNMCGERIVMLAPVKMEA